jgi:hypothetical protein
MTEIHCHRDELYDRARAVGGPGFAEYICKEADQWERVAGGIGPWRYKIMNGAYRAFIKALPEMDYAWDGSAEDQARMEADQQAARAQVPEGAAQWITLYVGIDPDWEDDQDYPFNWADAIADIEP